MNPPFLVTTDDGTVRVGARARTSIVAHTHGPFAMLLPTQVAKIRKARPGLDNVVRAVNQLLVSVRRRGETASGERYRGARLAFQADSAPNEETRKCRRHGQLRGHQRRETLMVGRGKVRKTELAPDDAIRLGVHPRTLYALRDSGEIEQVARGFYRLSEKPALTNPGLVAAALRIPRAVICLTSALAHYGLTTEVPHTADVALPGHAQIPKLGGIPLRVFWYSEPSFSAGVQSVSIDGVDVRIYSPEKSMADCFKYRNKIGLDVAVQALRAYRERTRPDLKLISKFAGVDRVEKVMRPYLEAVL